MENDLNSLDAVFRALKFAAEAHGGQKRAFSRKPYITHLLDVVATLERFGMPRFMSVAGALHDVIEDTKTTREQVENAFGGLVAGMVQTLSHAKGEPHGQILKRLHEADWATQTVKLADIIDNVQDIAETNQDFAERYIPEKEAEVAVLDRAEVHMRAEAFKVLKEAREHWGLIAKEGT